MVDNFVQSGSSSRSLVNTSVCSTGDRRKAADGTSNFFDLALRTKGSMCLGVSCMNCSDFRHSFARLRRSALLPILLGDRRRLTRIMIAKRCASSPLIRASSVKRAHLGGSLVRRAPMLFKRTSVVGALRALPNMSTNATKLTKVCIQNNGKSSGLCVVRKGPLCRVGRINNLFSSFGTRTMGSMRFFGSTFPTHCKKELSDMISVRAGSNGVGRCRKDTVLKLASNDLGLRNPLIGSQASFGFTLHHS